MQVEDTFELKREHLLFRWHGQKIEHVHTGACVGEVCACTKVRERECILEREKAKERERERERVTEKTLSLSMARAAD